MGFQSHWRRWTHNTSCSSTFPCLYWLVLDQCWPGQTRHQMPMETTTSVFKRKEEKDKPDGRVGSGQTLRLWREVSATELPRDWRWLWSILQMRMDTSLGGSVSTQHWRELWNISRGKTESSSEEQQIITAMLRNIYLNVNLFMIIYLFIY